MLKPSLFPVIKLLLLAFLVNSSCSMAQSYLTVSEANSSSEKYHVIIENIRTDAGLTANIISDGIRDHRGFLWTLTPNGVARFDGEDFLDLSRNKNHLQGTNIFTMAEDEKGVIWLLYLIPGTGSAS